MIAAEAKNFIILREQRMEAFLDSFYLRALNIKLSHQEKNKTKILILTSLPYSSI